MIGLRQGEVIAPRWGNRGEVGRGGATRTRTHVPSSLGPTLVCMPKSTRNSGTSWTQVDRQQLRALAHENTPTRVIGLKLGRTEDAVRAQASRENVSLKPTNQSPYNRRSSS